MTRNAKMVELAQHEKAQPESPENEKLILMLLSKDLRKSYMKTLADRLLESDSIAAIEDTDYPEEKQKKYHWILRFPVETPKGKDPDKNSFDLIFRVSGIPDLQLEKLPKQDSENLSIKVERYKEVLQSCKEREKNPAFVKLAMTDAVLRSRKQMILKYEKLTGSLDEKIAEVEKTYYQGIGYILSTAIEKITGIAILESLMKGLIYVMIIDDLDQRTQNGLVEIEFIRKVLSYMSSHELAEKVKAFRKEHAEEGFADASIGDFIFNSPDFANVDIVFFNSWKITEDTFPVRVALRKKAIVSKQEERKVEQKDLNKDKIVKAEEALKKLKEKLKMVMREINKMEKFHIDDEQAYQTQNNARKRVIKEIKRHELKLKELMRPVKAEGEEKIITFDLFEIFKSKQSFMERMEDKVLSIGLGGLLGMDADGDHRSSLKKLSEMAHYSKKWIKASAQLKNITSQTTRLAEQLDRFVVKNKMSVKVPGSRSTKKVNYQPLLDDHILDRLELAVLSCEISNLCENQQKQ